MRLNVDNPNSAIPKPHRNNFTLKWWISATCMQIQDVNYLFHQNHLQIQNIHHIPQNIPHFLKFAPTDISWNDNQMKPNHLYIFIDAAIYYNNDDPDPKSHIYGYGGGGITIFYNNKIIKSWINTITTAHISIPWK